MYREQLEQSATPELEARIGDLYWLTGDRAEADRHWVLAEAGWTSDTPEPTLLARFMAERNRKIPQAIAMAEQAAGTRRDIFTMDALAWAYFRAGRLAEAARASQEALRTGTRDRHILYHAAAVNHALGNAAAAYVHLQRALDGSPNFDPIVSRAAQDSMARVSERRMSSEQLARK